jgi:hypothetical protein
MANTHRSCEAATLTITATGKIPGYELTISSTFGGSVYAIFHQEEMVIDPNETESISDVPTGTVVNLIAEPQENYCFANWTGDVHTIANTNVGQTTITVDDHYSITASFRDLPPQPRNWALTGGIAAAAVALVGLVIFLTRRKRGVDRGRALN